MCGLARKLIHWSSLRNFIFHVLNFRGWSRPRNYSNSETFPTYGRQLTENNHLDVWIDCQISKIPKDTMRTAFVILTHPELMPYILFVVHLLEQVYENNNVSHLTKFMEKYLCWCIINCRYQQCHHFHYGLQLMDILFTKEELSGSLLFKSKRSGKPGLDLERVAKLL